MIMFEVILLALMGSNNAAREVAGERKIMEKEKFGGVRPVSYLLSKLAFLTCLILAQSLWMAMFVEFFWQFSGSFISHISFLILVNALINSVKLIDHLFILTKGGPNDASKLILYYIWEMAFAFFDAPQAAAMTILILLVLGVVAGVKFTILDKRTYYQ